LFVAAAADPVGAGAGAGVSNLLPPREVYRVLRAIAASLALPDWLASSGPGAGIELAAGEPARALVRRLLAPDAGPDSPAFRTAIDVLRRATAEARGPVEPLADRWIHAEHLALFLLAPVVLRLGWPRAIMRTLGPVEPRALSYVLAGVGSAIIGRAEESPQTLSTAVSLLAGLGRFPDLPSLRRFLDLTSTVDRQALLGAVLEAPPATAAATWTETFAALARALVTAFGETLHGFRTA
jgi:hypothetical protein